MVDNEKVCISCNDEPAGEDSDLCETCGDYQFVCGQCNQAVWKEETDRRSDYLGPICMDCGYSNWGPDEELEQDLAADLAADAMAGRKMFGEDY